MINAVSDMLEYMKSTKTNESFLECKVVFSVVVAYVLYTCKYVDNHGWYQIWHRYLIAPNVIKDILFTKILSKHFTIK